MFSLQSDMFSTQQNFAVPRTFLLPSHGNRLKEAHNSYTYNGVYLHH